MQRYSDERLCQDDVSSDDSLVQLHGRSDMLADKEPRLTEPCFTCGEPTDEQSCAIVIRGFPTTDADEVDAVSAIAVCLKHADDLADMLDQPYVNDGVRKFGIWADLDAIESRCSVCGGSFDEEHGVIGLGSIRLHVACADAFVETLRNRDAHADELLGVSL